MQIEKLGVSRRRQVSFRHTLIVYPILLTVLCVAAASFSKGGDKNNYSVGKNVSKGEERGSIAEASVVPRQSGDLKAQLVTVYSNGFDPDEIELPHEPFMLCIDNKTGMGPLTFSLNSELAQEVYTQTVDPGQIGTYTVLDLEAGEYSLLVRDHAKWTCKISIAK